MRFAIDNVPLEKIDTLIELMKGCPAFQDIGMSNIRRDAGWRPIGPQGQAAQWSEFMLFIAFFDTGDWMRSARQNREEPIVFAPK